MAVYSQNVLKNERNPCNYILSAVSGGQNGIVNVHAAV